MLYVDRYTLPLTECNRMCAEKISGDSFSRNQSSAAAAVALVLLLLLYDVSFLSKIDSLSPWRIEGHVLETRIRGRNMFSFVPAASALPLAGVRDVRTAGYTVAGFLFLKQVAEAYTVRIAHV